MRMKNYFLNSLNDGIDQFVNDVNESVFILIRNAVI